MASSAQGRRSSKMNAAGNPINPMEGGRADILGLTLFDCQGGLRDLRNSNVIDIIKEFRSYAVELVCHASRRRCTSAVHA
jgi:hypothetical protein